MSLVDLYTLSQVNFQWEALAQKYLELGNKVTIDQDLLLRHPILSPIYEKFGKSTRCLTVNRITQTQLTHLLLFFTDIKQLSLLNMRIVDEGFPALPESITDLQLISCHIQEDYLKKWFSAGGLRLLESLYIDRLVYKRTTYQYQENLQLVNFGQLKTVTLKGEQLNVEIDLHHLTTLTIVANDLARSRFVNCPNLETLVFDVADRKYVEYHNIVHKIKSLTLRYLDIGFVYSCSKLKYLKVFRSVDPKQQEQLMQQRTHQKIKTVDVHYYSPPSTPNLILDKLTNDVLLKIADYLSVEDCVSLGCSHERFNALFVEYKCHKYDLRVDRHHYLLLYSPALGISNRFSSQSEYVTKLHVSDGKERYLQLFLPHFQRLTTLELRLCTLMSPATIAVLPVGLQSLSLIKCKLGEGIREYFSRLNPTLTDLVFRSLLVEDCLQVLNNIRTFKFHSSKPNHVYREFLRNNAKHLERIEVLPERHGEDQWNAPNEFGMSDRDKDTDRSRSVQAFGYLRIIQEMPQLKSLVIARNIKGDDMDDYEDGFGMEIDERRRNEGPHPENFSHLVSFFTAVGPRLKELVLRVRGKGFRAIVNGEFLSKLESLHLISYSRVIWEEDLQVLCGMRTMRKFEFQANDYLENNPMTFRNIFRLIDAWPQLEEMTIHEFGLDLRKAERLSKYLRDNNRKLVINKSEYNGEIGVELGIYVFLLVLAVEF